MPTLFAPALAPFIARALPMMLVAALALTPAMATAQADDAATIADTSTVVDMALGDDDAPVTMIEYASFTCPHCATFHAEIMPQLKRDYIDTGKVRFVHREVFFDRYGLWAGIVARCGGEMRYFGVADMIYSRMGEWTRGADAAAVADNLRRIGRTAGLSDDQLDACLTDGDKAQALVTWYQDNATRDGVESTPSFVIDGERFSNMSYAELRRILDDKIAAAEG